VGNDKPDWTYVSEISAGIVQIDTSGGPVSVDATGSTVLVEPTSTAVFNISGSVDANITNSTLDVNITNATITVEPSTNSTWDVNITNATLNVSGTVTVDSIQTTVTVSGDVNANITNSSIAITNATDDQGNPIPLDINVTNSVINVSGSVDANITNSTLTIEPATGATFDVNVTNSTINVSGSVDANITNSTIVVEPAGGATFNVSGSVDVSGSEININTINTTVEVQAPTGDILRATELYDKTYVFTRSVSLSASTSDTFSITIAGKIAQIAVSFTFSDYTSPLNFRIEIYEPSTGATYQWTAADLLTLSGYYQAVKNGFAYSYKDFSPTSAGYVDTVFVDADNLGKIKAAGFVIRIPIKMNASSSNEGYIKVENLDSSLSCTVDYGAVFLHY